MSESYAHVEPWPCGEWEARQVAHEAAKRTDPDHDECSCWCCCLTCDRDYDD